MNYIYDVTLNLSRKLYEFYEWKEEDNIEFILKIPIIKIDLESFLDIKYNDVIIDKKILNMIEDKTESYSPNNINIIRYSCIFVCEDSALAVEFDSEGNNYMKSNLSIEEEDEILESSINLKYTLIEYKIKNKIRKNKRNITRLEENTQKQILVKLDNMIKNNEKSKLKYIFFELYNEKLDDINRIYDKLISLVINESEKIVKLNNILNLIDYKKIMSNNS